MSDHLEGDIISPPEAPNGGVIRVERVWQHRHDLEIRIPKRRHHPSALLTLAAGGIVLGVLCMLAYSDPAPTQTPVLKEAIASYPVGWEAAAVATKLRDIIDVAPAPMMANITETQTASIPYTVIPTKRPVFETSKPSGAGRANPVISTSSSAKVSRYDRCNPSCETRYPLVVGTIPPKNSALSPDSGAEITEIGRSNQAVKVGTAVFNGAGFVLVQTAALPFTRLKLGRDAITKLSELD
ncbi:hypothetical protein ACQZ6V_15685 [Agrobacterium sp. 22-3674b3]